MSREHPAGGKRWQYEPVSPGFTPLDLAEQHGHATVADLLRRTSVERGTS